MSPGGLPPSDDYIPGHGHTSYDVTHYALDLTYSIQSNRLEGRAALTVVALEELDSLKLDLHGLNVTKVSVDGAAAKYRHKRNALTITLAEPLPAEKPVEISVRYSGNPASVRSRHLGSAGWDELADGVIVAAQPHGAPSWFPCNDRPSNKASYDITVTTASDYTVISNGALTDRRRGSRLTTWVYQQSEPMATYLATLQIGHYDLFEIEGARVPVTIAAPGALRDRLHTSLGRQGEMLEFYAETFGDYPFGSYRVVVTADDLEIPLESQGLSTFGANFLRQDWDAVRLVAHELSHQWFGNSLTVGLWRDIWLHEGFACYSEWLWSEHAGDRTADEHAVEHWNRLDGLEQDLVLSDPGPDLMFDDRVYKRGALFLHALRVTVGDASFFDALASWVAEHTYGTVDTAGFVDHVVSRTTRDVRDLADRWLHEPALPALPRPT